MHIIYTLVRLFPFWAVPLAFVLGELGITFKRKHKPVQYFCWGSAGFLVLLSLIWGIMRGDLHSDSWVKAFFG